MKIKEIYIENGEKTTFLPKNGEAFSGGGFEVYIKEDGGVFLKGEGAELSFLNICFDNEVIESKNKDMLVLGDAWERGYGDLGWKRPDQTGEMPWYFAAYDQKRFFGFGVKTQPNGLCSWNVRGGTLRLRVDLRNGTNPYRLPKEGLEVCKIVFAEYDGDIYSAMKSFCADMCDNPRMPKRPIFGGNDWYCCYGENSFEKIKEHTKKVVECSKGLKFKPYMVIDDGWEICHHQSENDYEYYNGGPWKYCNNNFGDMKKTAEMICEEGAIPGIWFRPLWTCEKFEKEYYLKNDGIKYTLDPSHPKVLEQIKSDVKCLVGWGYKLIKHDFSTFDIFGGWGDKIAEANDITFYDKTKTTAQIIKNFYNAIREAAGEEVLLMGCNTLSHLSAGVFDLQRTGDDTSGLDWERTKKYGVNTLAFRMVQHGTFYCVDADCVGLTDKISVEKNKMWLDVLAKSGTPLFVSIDENFCYASLKGDIAAAFKKSSENNVTSKPLDWLENITPSRWESAYGTDSYEW